MSAADDVTLAFRRNVVVAASAGTGKTHRLTGLYVMLALGLTSMGKRTTREAHPPVAPDRIVATTFSKAAALEIRTRIEAALGAIARSAPEAPFALEIAARTAALDDPPSAGEIALRAERALASFHEARIQTLHGLSADLLRRHALALGVSPALRVLEEAEQEALSFGVIDEMLAHALGGSEREQDAARALASACGGFFRAREALLPFFDRLDDDGIDLASLGTSDYLRLALELRQRLLTATHAAMGSAKPAIRAGAESLARAMEAEGPPPAGEASLGPTAERALGELFALRKPGKMEPAEMPIFALRDELKASGTNAAKGKVLAATLREAGVLEARERAMLELLVSIRGRLVQERLQRGVAGFSDLLRLARDGLRDRPEALAAAREEIDVLLVDEFQDTSLVQRDLVYLLRGLPDAPRDTPAPRAPPAILEHGLFIVGDRKQSIYAFRGADVAVFNRVCGELTGEDAHEKLDLPRELCTTRPIADLVALSTSYRSSPRIVTFVNAFFERDFAQTALGADSADDAMLYGPAEHLSSAKPSSDERVVFVADDGAPTADDDALPEPLLASAGPPLREAFVAAAAARALIEEGGFSPRDVAILARRRATIPLLELGLSRMSIPYVVAGRALFDTLEVRDLSALVRLVLEPRDRHALAHVLRGPLCALSDEALLALTTGRGLSAQILDREARSPLDPSAFPEEARRLEAFRAKYHSVAPTLLRLPAPEALRTAMEAFELDLVMAALPRAPSRIGNLDRLVHIARERGGSLFSFSRWLVAQIENEADESEAVVFSAEDDAVRLSTIHGAKGLDFPATVVVDLAARERPAYPPLRFTTLPGEDKPRLVADHKGERGARLENPAKRHASRVAAARALHERSRISYVGLTRARKVLCLVGSSRPAPKGSMLHTFEFHKDTGLAGRYELEHASALLARALASPEAVAPGRDASPANDDEPIPLPSSAPPARPRRGAGELSIATTPLSVFRGCARRFQFRFLLGLEEPVDTGQLDLFELDPTVREKKVVAFEDASLSSDPRETGRAAHRVLERLPKETLGTAELADATLAAALEREGVGDEAARVLAASIAVFARGPYAARLGAARELSREAEVALVVAPRRSDAPSLCLRGTVDVFARFDEGIDLVDYKLAAPSPSLDRYAFQLRAYALALSKRAPGGRVRAGIVFLGGDATAPRWLEGASGTDVLGPEDHARFEEELATLAAKLAEARATDRWPGVALPVCRAERCGFVTACHRTSEALSTPAPKRRRRS